METTSQHLSREQLIASLRSCAASVAGSSTALAAQIAAEKFSFESEFAVACGGGLSEILAVPAPAQGQETPVLPLGTLQQVLAQQSPQPCVIPPIQGGKTKRPLWTVAIPACDPNPEYFSVLLSRVVRALSKTASWEIVIVDGSSKKEAFASVADLLSKHAISIFSLSEGAGPLAARNECLRRARGEFVHILQQDDFVFEHFYSELGAALKSHPQAGLAACRNEFIDSRGQVISIKAGQEKSGLYCDTTFAVVWAYRIPFSAVVVRRALYEKLGGFHEDLGLWAEWEMRARLLAASPLWFHQDVLMLPRLHAASWRQKEMRAARGLDACAQAVSRAIKYYPASISKDFGKISADLFAREFAHFGCCLVTANQLREGMVHFEAATRLSSHPNILEIAKRRSFHLLKSQMLKTSATPTSSPSQDQPQSAAADGDFFPADELQNLQSVVAAYRATPADPDAVGQARALRNGLCTYLLDAEAASLQNLFAGNFKKVFLLVWESGITAEDAGDEEKQLAQRAVEILSASSGDPRGLLATMLLFPAHRAVLKVEFSGKPDWLLGMYMDYLLASPDGFVLPGEADRYWEHLSAILTSAGDEIARRTTALSVKNALFQVALRLNVIPAYFSERDMKELMRMRARVVRFLLEQNGHRLEATFPPRPFHRKKIRVGFLSAHLGPQTETYTSVPSFYLDREKFEIHLFVLGSNPSAIENHARSVADSFTVLPPQLAARIAALRGAELDVLVIGTNMTAVTNDVTLLGSCRLAPIQIASSSSPMTPGLPHLDGFLSGIVHGYDAYSGQYNERLLLFDGAISCLEYSVDRPKTETVFKRRDFGIPDGVPIFVSGANFFKILPELQATWAKVLQRVPGSYLLLHPFNRNWSSRYPIARFRRDICRVFEQAGVDPARIVISEKTLPSSADVCQLMALGDVYLDSFPFSGSVSLVDPLEAGVPPVAWRAFSTRGLMAASMLSDLDLRELVAESEEEYVASARPSRYRCAGT
ncbi:MAG: glycosyltransferase [Nibricoccus sp.]